MPLTTRIPFGCSFAVLSKYRTGDSTMLARARLGTLTITTAVCLVAAGQAARAQQPAPPPAAVPAGPAVNDVAPDFTLAGADKYGLLKTPVRLSDYRGRTVVLAFFYQARTKG
jgi:cytochrome oxidase Cu insertion factor (SCO1/SenC/PrrC family)